MMKAHAMTADAASAQESRSAADDDDNPRKRARSSPSHSPAASASLPLPALHLCGVCTSTFPSNALLQKHLIALHGSSNALPMSDGSESDEDASDEEAEDDQPLPAAAYTTTAAALSTVPPAKKRPRPTAVFPCPTDGCTKSFHYKHVLANHIRAIHTKETPFACGVCSRKFPTLARKVAHEGTHLKFSNDATR
jgi:hypothetical protein